MKWNLGNHINGKVYDLTQENMNRMIADIEILRDKIECLKDELGATLMSLHDVKQECIQYSLVLDLIACPPRSDGTYNRDRKACEQLAKEVLGYNRMSKALD